VNGSGSPGGCELLLDAEARRRGGAEKDAENAFTAQPRSLDYRAGRSKAERCGGSGDRTLLQRGSRLGGRRREAIPEAVGFSGANVADMAMQNPAPFTPVVAAWVNAVYGTSFNGRRDILPV
jgi:hypothetical protein